MDDESDKSLAQLREELADTRQQLALQQAAERVREAVLAMRRDRGPAPGRGHPVPGDEAPGGWRIRASRSS